MWNNIAEIWRTGWDVHPFLLLIIAALGGLYAIGVWAIGSRLGERLSAGRGAAFGLGLGILLLSLHSPLHHLSDDYLFSAHMVQHQLLTLVVPPLLLLGMPGWLLGWALNCPWLTRMGHTRAYPVLAFLIFNIVFAYAHFPAIYDGIFGNEISHRGAHVVFLATAILTWLPLLSPAPHIVPRLSQPAQMLYCFLQTLPGSLVGALLTLSDRVLYSHYATRPLEIGVSPIDDQQVGGLLTWVVGGTFWLAALTVIFFIWADQEEKKAYGQS